MPRGGCGEAVSSPVRFSLDLSNAHRSLGRHSRGHGTYVQDDEVLASVAGTLERVNKLVSVRPLRTK